MSPDPQLLRAFLASVVRDSSGQRAPTWASWRLQAIGLPLAAVLVGCGGDSSDPPHVGEGLCDTPCTEECSDGVDNDEDGTVDCADPDCAELCVAGTGGTGGVTGTGGFSGVAYGIPYEYVCDDGIDNDLDGEVDCADSDCNCGTGGVSTGGTGGTGGDAEGGTDAMDGGGAGGDVAGGAGGTGGFMPGTGGSYGIPYEYLCDDGVDNDSDGATDCADSDCSSDSFCATPSEDCTNGVDDDNDGAEDCADEDCWNNPNCITLYAAPM